MSQDLASLYIKVDSKGVVTASRDLNKLTGDSKKTETATEGVTKSFSKLQAVVVALASSYALLKMAQYVKDAALLAARYETLGVVMRVVGNNAGYTGAQMDKFARGLQKAGIAMVESRNTLARMIQAQIDLTSSQKLARIAQNAAVIGNMNSSAAFEHMIYGLQTGHPRILRTIGLNVNFDKSVRALADSLGIKRKAMSEVQVMQGRVNAVIKAGILIEGAYEGAMETAGKKLTSFIRYVDDFKVKMGEAFGPATVMLVDAATQAMKDMQEQISRPEAQEALRNLSSQLAITIVQLGQDLPKAIKSTTNAIADIQAIYNFFPEGVVGAAGAGLIGRILFGGWGPAKIVAGLYLINKGMSSIGMGLGDIAKSYKDATDNFQKAWETMAGQRVKGLLFHKMPEFEALSQYEKMQEMLAKGIPIKLDFAFEDPDKYFGEIISALEFAWEKEGFESIEKWYKSIETLAQEKMDFISELENEETRIFEENLAYRLTVQKKYYEDIEAAAQEARDFDEEMEDEALRMAREAADYQKELANEAADYIDKLAEAASYYKDLIGFEETYHEKMLELIEAEAEARAKATGDDVAAAKWAAQEKGRLEQDLFENKTKYIDEGFGALASSFSDIASLYDKGSDAAKRWEEASKAMEIAQRAVAVVNAVAAIANQGLGDPYTAFARIAAMVAAMTSLLASIGESVSGGSGGGISAPALPASTVLGAEAGTGSQSIANAWELLQDTYDMEYRELSGIHNEMKNLNDNISGLVASIFRTGGIDTSYIPTGTTLGNMQSFADDIIELSYLGFSDIINTLTFGISGWIDSTISSLIGSIFGGETTTSVTGSGISTGAASVSSLVEGGGIGSQQYSNVHVHEEGGWFHSDKDYYYTTYKALDESVTRLFDKVFQNMSNTLIELTLGLGTNMNATLNYVFSGAKISLQGMDSDEINKTLTEYFSNIGDKAVDALFGNILGTYQKVGEGLMETAARILIDKVVILDALERTNQAFYGSIASVIAFSESVIKMAGGLDEFIESAAMYYDKFFSDAEKHANLQADLLNVFADMNLALPATRAGYRNLVEGLNLNTEVGKEAYVTLLKLAKGADEFYSGLEDMQQKVFDLQRQLFNELISEQGAVVNTVQGYVNKLKMARESMTMEGTAFAAQQVTSAWLAFHAVLDQAKTGNLSGIADIDKVLSTLTASVSSTAGFSTRADYERNFYQTYNAIAELEKLAETQLSVEKQTLIILQQQLNELMGVFQTTAEALAVAQEQEAIAIEALTVESEILTIAREQLEVQRAIPVAIRQLGDFFSRSGFAEGGISSGPETGYAAKLHGTELIVSPRASYPAKVMGADSPELLAEVKKLREEIKAGNFASVKNSNKMAKILTRFDDDGLPDTRTV